MLKIVIPPSDMWDERKNEFVPIPGCELQLEHSLVSISKWEAKWNKTFLSKVHKTNEETLDYIKCMTITQNVNPIIYTAITDKQISEISAYINAPMTAVHFSDDDTKQNSRRTVTSEVIYSWMIALNIPVEFQKWHLNRLLTLIRVCNIENQPKKKRHSSKEILSRNAALNAARRQRYNTKG